MCEDEYFFMLKRKFLFCDLPVHNLLIFLRGCYSFLKDFIYFRERQKEYEQEGQRERKNLKLTPGWALSPTWGSIPWAQDHDLSQNQESNVQQTTPSSRPCWSFFYWFVRCILSIRKLALSFKRNHDFLSWFVTCLSTLLMGFPLLPHPAPCRSVLYLCSQIYLFFYNFQDLRHT